jgi:hypothetical protein
MKQTAKRFLRRMTQALGIDGLRTELADLKHRTELGTKALQLGLMHQYRANYHAGVPPPSFREVEFRAFSQHGEDGILLYIFALLGTTDRRSIELCAGNGIECNTANLLLNHGWSGALFDGSQINMSRAKHFYETNPDTRYWPPACISAWVTRENVNELVANTKITGEIDLLSIDVDGIDYWLWESLEIVRPRIVILEFNHLWGPEAAVSVPYRADFKADFTEYGSDYAGASLAAFVKLGRRKGYRLVGANRIATNALFVRNDLPHPWLPEVEAGTVFGHPRARFGREVRFHGIKDRDWVRID